MRHLKRAAGRTWHFCKFCLPWCILVALLAVGGGFVTGYEWQNKQMAIILENYNGIHINNRHYFCALEKIGLEEFHDKKTR